MTRGLLSGYCRILKVGTIAGAESDVYEQKPGFEPHPAEMGNVIVVPHIGSTLALVATRTKMTTVVVRDVIYMLKEKKAARRVILKVWNRRQA